MKPEQKLISAYFNVDNGTGKIRGVYTQGNAAIAPIFAQWIAPLKDLGVTTITNRNTGGTDHLSFDAVGIPGFQFIQDDAGLREPHPPLQRGCLRAAAAGRPEADCHGRGHLPLQRGAARPDAAAQAAAAARPGREEARARSKASSPERFRRRKWRKSNDFQERFLESNLLRDSPSGRGPDQPELSLALLGPAESMVSSSDPLTSTATLC